MKGEQRVFIFRGLHLIGVESAEGAHIHGRTVDHLAFEQRDAVFQHLLRAVDPHEFDSDLGGLLHGHRLLRSVEVVIVHMRDPRDRAGFGPVFHHAVRVFLCKLLDRACGSAVRIPLAQHRIDGRTQHDGKPLLECPLVIVFRLFGI